jgi:hypothetical protein
MDTLSLITSVVAFAIALLAWLECRAAKEDAADSLKLMQEMMRIERSDVTVGGTIKNVHPDPRLPSGHHFKGHGHHIHERGLPT